ncbi:MAG: lysophospholipid acyltransferase family protein [Pseudomonadota bacterium]
MKRLFQAFLRAYEYTIFYACLLLIGLLCLGWSLPALLLHAILPRPVGMRLGRFVIMSAFRVYLKVLSSTGRFHLDLSELDALKNQAPLIIAPNHPSLWDVVMIVSRLPNVSCIMKGELVGNLFLGTGSRLAGYIRNESLRRMIMLAIGDLRQGGHLLLFPEGTRSLRHPVNPLKGSIGLIACRAQVPVQTVLIETDSPFLTKGWPVYRIPRLPLTFKVRLGRRFDAPDDTTEFMLQLERYFAEALADAQLPFNASAGTTCAADPNAQSETAALQ